MRWQTDGPGIALLYRANLIPAETAYTIPFVYRLQIISCGWADYLAFVVQPVYCLGAACVGWQVWQMVVAH